MKKIIAIIMLVLLIVMPILSYAAITYHDAWHECSGKSHKGNYNIRATTKFIPTIGVDGEHTKYWKRYKAFICCGQCEIIQDAYYYTEKCNSDGGVISYNANGDTVKCSLCKYTHKVPHKHDLYALVDECYFVDFNRGWYISWKCQCGAKGFGEYNYDPFHKPNY